MPGRITRPKLVRHTAADVTILQNLISPGESATFDEVRISHPRFEDYTDGQLYQLAIDAGMAIDPNRG